MIDGVGWILMKIIDYVYQLFRHGFHYVLAGLYMFSRRKVPPVQDPILLMSATKLAKLIRERELTSEYVIRAFIQRILDVEPFINSTVERRFTVAIDEAKAADSLVASGTMTNEQLEKEKPLLGVPFSVKVLLTVKGLRSTAGSILFKDVRAQEDAASVALMRKAGAIVLVTTNSSEVGLGFQSINNLHGKTCNPYDTRKTSGGSSGGESALLGAAGSVIGIGNDLAGSIRIPCMFTGIFGHKPSRDLVSNAGCFPSPTPKLDKYLSTGPMCRYAEDLVTMMKILSTSTTESAQFGKEVNFKDIKVYYMHSFGDIPLTENVDADMKAAVSKAVSHFEQQQGSLVKELNLPLVKQSFPIFIHALLSSIPDVSDCITAGKEKVDGIQELLKFLCLKSRFTLGYILALIAPKVPLIYEPSLVESYRKLQDQLDNQINYLLDDNSVLILPTLPFPAPYHHEIIPLLGSSCYTSIFNILGLPGTQCPVGLNKQAVPVGVQILSRRGNDQLTIACALEMEKAFGGWKPPK